MFEMRNRVDRLVPVAFLLAAISAIFWLILVWSPDGTTSLVSDVNVLAIVSGVLAGLTALTIVLTPTSPGTPKSVIGFAAVLFGLSALVASVMLWVGGLGVGDQFHFSDDFFAVSAILIPAAIIVASLELRQSTFRLGLCLGVVAIFWSPVLVVGHGFGIAPAFKVMREHLVFGYDLYGLTVASIFISWLILLVVGKKYSYRQSADSDHTMNDR